MIKASWEITTIVLRIWVAGALLFLVVALSDFVFRRPHRAQVLFTRRRGIAVAPGSLQHTRAQHAVRKIHGGIVVVNIRMALLLVVVVVVISLGGCGVHTVDTGHRGIKVSFGQVEGPPLVEGLYFVNPVTTTIRSMDVRILRWDGKTEAYTKDVQEAKVEFVLNYKLRPEAAADVYRSVGDDWANKLVTQVVYQHLKNVIGQWDAVDLIANRQKANDAAQEAIVQGLGASNIDVTGFAITDFEFSHAFNEAVESKVIAQQRAQEAQNRTEQIKQEAQQKVIAATAEAQSMKIRADALMQNPRLVSWEAVQKWDGKLPVNMYGGAAIPFVDVNGK